MRLEVRDGTVACYLDEQLVQEAAPQRWPTLAATASLAGGGREIIVKVVNASGIEQDIDMELAGIAGVEREGEEIQIHDADPEAENTLDAPQRVVGDLACNMRRRVPGNSVTVLRMRTGKRSNSTRRGESEVERL